MVPNWKTTGFRVLIFTALTRFADVRVRTGAELPTMTLEKAIALKRATANKIAEAFILK
jgi:hypothetical protein